MISNTVFFILGILVGQEFTDIPSIKELIYTLYSNYYLD